MNKVIIIDTSILCVLLKVDKMDTCGNDKDKWDFDGINKLIEEEINKGAFLVLPLATIIETGNHIAQAEKQRYETAKRLADFIIAAADGKKPWAIFTEQSSLWEAEELKKLAEEWPTLAIQNISIGDATIKRVAEYYAKNNQVEILTGDAGLKSYQPTTPPAPTPRRRKR